MKIAKQIKSRQDKIQELLKEIAEIRRECESQGHQGKLTGVYKGDTGNYDRSDDSYWVVLECPECGSLWYEDQDDVAYDRVDKVMRTSHGIMFTKVASNG